jgi:hypothetical protein
MNDLRDYATSQRRREDATRAADTPPPAGAPPPIPMETELGYLALGLPVSAASKSATEFALAEITRLRSVLTTIRDYYGGSGYIGAMAADALAHSAHER